MTNKKATIILGAKDDTQRAFDALERRTKRLKGSTDGLTASTKRYNTANSKMRTGARSSRGVMQQMGYQIQDVSVQLQGGQNALLVFSQQGSQMAGAFGPSGAVIGALIAVSGALAGVLMPTLMENKDAMGELEKMSDELGTSFDGLSSDTAILTDRMQKLYKTNRAAFFAELENDVYDARDALKNLKGQVSELGDSSLEFDESGFKSSLNNIDNLSETIARMQDEFVGLTEAQANTQILNRYKNSISEIAKEMDIAAPSAATLASKFLAFQNGQVSPESLQQTADSFANQSEEAAEFADELRKLTTQWTQHNTELKTAQAILNGEDPLFEDPNKKTKEVASKGVVGGRDPRRDKHEQVLQGEREATAKYLEEVKNRNELLRLEYEANKNQPWMIGLVSPDDLQSALDDIDSRLQAAHEKELARNRERLEAGATLVKGLMGLQEQKFAHKREDLERELKDSENMSQAEIAAKEAAAKKAFKNEKKWAKNAVDMNTGVAAMNALTIGDPFTKWTQFATVIAEGQKQKKAIDQRTWEGGASPSGNQTQAPAQTTISNDISVNVDGGNPSLILEQLNEYVGRGGSAPI